MKQATQDKNGNPIVIEVPDVLPEPITNWHEPTKPIRLVISHETKKDLLLKKQEDEIYENYQDLKALLNYVKTLQAPKVHEGGVTYIYLDEVYPQHKALLEKYGIEIVTK